MEAVKDFLAGLVSTEIAIQESVAAQQRNALSYVGGPPWNKTFGLYSDYRNGSLRRQPEDVAINLMIDISISHYEDGLIPKLVDEV